MPGTTDLCRAPIVQEQCEQNESDSRVPRDALSAFEEIGIMDETDEH